MSVYDTKVGVFMLY